MASVALASHEAMLPSSVCSTSRVSGEVTAAVVATAGVVASSVVVLFPPSVLGLKEAKDARAMAEASSVAPTFSDAGLSVSGATLDFCLLGETGGVLASFSMSSMTRLADANGEETLMVAGCASLIMVFPSKEIDGHLC